jgi:hypothetical protein
MGEKKKPKPKYYCRFAAENNLVKHAWRYTPGNPQFPHSGGLRQKGKRLKCGNRILSKASEMINLLEIGQLFLRKPHTLHFHIGGDVRMLGDKRICSISLNFRHSTPWAATNIHTDKSNTYLSQLFVKFCSDISNSFLRSTN